MKQPHFTTIRFLLKLSKLVIEHSSSNNLFFKKPDSAFFSNPENVTAILADTVAKTAILPSFKADTIVYNRHGIGLFGYHYDAECCGGKGDYRFYFADPESKKFVQGIGEAERYRDGGSSSFSAKDKKVSYDGVTNDGGKTVTYLLNCEPATRLDVSLINKKIDSLTSSIDTLSIK